MEAAEDKNNNKKKKRNNKKKKNNNQKAVAAADDASSVADSTASAEAIPDGVQVSGEAEANGAERRVLGEAENKHWLQKEAKLEELIKQLGKDKDLQMQKEATLEGTVKELQKERELLIQKEATLEGTIKLLREEKDAHMQKEVTLEDTIRKLREETDSRIHQEANLQKEIVQLRSEKDSWFLKEAGLEEKVSRLAESKSTLDSEVASLQERIKRSESDRDTWNLKEDSFKEMIATQTDNIAKLRTQMLELEQSRDNLVQENQQLMGNLSSLESQIKDRESVSSSLSSVEGAKHAAENKELNSQIEAACTLIEKLITENADLVEKVNELCVELEQKSGPPTAPGMPGDTAVIINQSRSGDDISTSGQKPFSSEGALPLKVETVGNGNMYSKEAAAVQSNGDLDVHVRKPSILYVSSESEIVQIPLDASEVPDLELQSATQVENEAVSISDAPLIGAPFRLVSFVARYVSGADLVNKS